VAIVEVPCPECGSHEVVKYGRQANGEQRYRCNNVACERRIFLVRYHNTGRLPVGKTQSLTGPAGQSPLLHRRLGGLSSALGSHRHVGASGGRNSWSGNIAHGANV